MKLNPENKKIKGPGEGEGNHGRPTLVHCVKRVSPQFVKGAPAGGVSRGGGGEEM